MVFLQYDPALAPGDRERLEQLGQGVDDVILAPVGSGFEAFHDGRLGRRCRLCCLNRIQMEPTPGHHHFLASHLSSPGGWRRSNKPRLPNDGGRPTRRLPLQPDGVTYDVLDAYVTGKPSEAPGPHSHDAAGPVARRRGLQGRPPGRLVLDQQPNAQRTCGYGQSFLGTLA